MGSRVTRGFLGIKVLVGKECLVVKRKRVYL